MLIKALVVNLVFVCAAGPIGESGVAGAKTAQRQQQAISRYACPMDPAVISAKPGKCPKCGMALRLVADKVDEGAARASITAGEGSGNISSISARIPDIRVYDQNGRPLSFYSDLVKGKTVAIDFIFTTCTTICPPLSATFRMVQHILIERAPSYFTAPRELLHCVSIIPARDSARPSQTLGKGADHGMTVRGVRPARFCWRTLDRVTINCVRRSSNTPLILPSARPLKSFGSEIYQTTIYHTTT